MKPILFNTEMVRAILDGRKTQTRRVIKAGDHRILRGGTFLGADVPKYGVELDNHGVLVSRYQPGDILYVRETWATPYGKGYYYAADYQSEFDVLKADNGDVSVSKNLIRWRPSIHMPKKAARLFLRVTDVRVERLQDMSTEDAKKEGAETDDWLDLCEEAGVVGLPHCTLREYFGSRIWDRTISGEENWKLYGWDANPWVLVIEFERCDKPREDK